MAFDRTHTARGAVAGAIAAGVWSAQSPLDRRFFGVSYADEELLGKAITRGPAWPAVGVAVHLVNGALFGAAYANVAPRLPLPSWARGPVAGLGEHLATWPLTMLVQRLHPARDELPRLWGSTAAFAQSTWRHVLFGTVLGEIERRLNAPPPEALETYEHYVSSNGHGKLEHAAAGAE